jgi:hypothetical protein
MSDNEPELSPEEWATMEEAQRITGMSRQGLMLRKARGKLEARTVPALLSYQGKRTYFRRSQLPRKEER